MNMHMKPFDHDELLKLDGDVPLVRSVPYGIQHALVMFVANLVLPRDTEAKVAASDSSAGHADDADAKGEQPAAYNCPLRAVAMGSEPSRGAASSDAVPASAPALVKAWGPFEKPHERAEK